MGTLEGKVAFITGAARGQGRSHAVRLAAEGANIIGIDLCAQVDSVRYPMATREDLEETVRLVEKQDRRMLAGVADVRDLDALTKAVAAGVQEFGSVDIVIANAGISSAGRGEDAFREVVDINLIGVWNTVEAARETMMAQGTGGSIVLTSSTAGLKGIGPQMYAGHLAYGAAKHGVVGLMRKYANLLAPYSIRVNSVHPCGVDTPMLVGWEASMTRKEIQAGDLTNPMPVELIESIDVSNAIAFLVSDAARYVTGVTFPVDAGFNNK